LLRLVMLGRTDSGKSSARNSILGKEEKIQAAATAATSTSTQQSESTQGEVAGKKVIVVETPDWFAPGLSLEKVREDVDLCVQMSFPGPHAFLLVIPVRHYTNKVHIEDELKVIIPKMEEMFGERCCRNTIILFTVTDEHQRKNTEILIQSENEEVQTLLEKCGNRFFCLNIKESGDDSQVSELFEKIAKMVKGSETFYSSDIYLKTFAYIGKIEEKISEKLKKLDAPGNRMIMRKPKNQAMEQHVKQLNENIEIGSQEVHEDVVTMEAEREEMKITLHEMWRSMLTATLQALQPQSQRKRPLPTSCTEMASNVLALIRTPESSRQIVFRLALITLQRIPCFVCSFVSELTTHVLGSILDWGVHCFGHCLALPPPKPLPAVTPEHSNLASVPEIYHGLVRLFSSKIPESPLRLVMLGRKDSGKSSARNIILGIEEKIQAAATAATSTSIQQSESTQGEVAGKKVIVVETPDWFCPELSLEKVREDVDLCVQMSSSGPHAFLLVIPVMHSTNKVHIEDELKVIIPKMEEMFGERCCRNTIILFTVTDEHQRKNTEILIQSENEEVQTLLEKCGNRFFCLNIKESGGGSQVSELFEKIEKMV
ncbi:GTPase IMAP family member 8, partial [Silurus meridionalis]